MNFSKYIDHTLLKPTATESDIIKLCKEAKTFNFYSVCVNPCYVETAKKYLKNTDIKIACVIGFPLGTTTTDIKRAEALEAVKNGATELDMVINNGLFKQKKYDEVISEINAVCESGAVVKVIIETSQHSTEEISLLCDIVNKSNATYIKTSTGFVGDGANIENIKLMKQKMNTNKKVKASGGIRSKEEFLDMINAGADRIGTSSGVKIITELEQLN